MALELVTSPEATPLGSGNERRGAGLLARASLGGGGGGVVGNVAAGSAGWHAARMGRARTARCIDEARMAGDLSPTRSRPAPVSFGYLPRKTGFLFS